jgi:hypothetical protein
LLKDFILESPVRVLPAAREFVRKCVSGWVTSVAELKKTREERWPELQA